MPITFPTPTTIGEQFASGGKTWQWNGYAWNSIANAAAIGATGIQGATGPTGSVDWTNYLLSIGQSPSIIDTVERNSLITQTVFASGTLQLMMFTPVVDITITKLSVNVIAVSTSPTFFKMGVYSYDETTNAATLLASTSNVPNTTLSVQLATLPLTSPSSITLTAGTRYAFAILGIHSTTPQLSASPVLPAIIGLTPTMGRLNTSQTDLPASINPSGTATTRYWIRGSQL